MSFRRSILSVATLIALHSPAPGEITIGPVRGQPGESIRLVTFSETKDGTVQSSGLGKVTTGTLEITRERELVWTFRAPAADGTHRGMVRVPKLTTTRTMIKGVESTTTKLPIRMLATKTFVKDSPMH